MSKMKLKKFWCRACGAYDSTQCEIVGHESEQMKAVDDTANGRVRWERYSKPRVTVATAPTFPTGVITEPEKREGWQLCDDPSCIPTMGGNKIFGHHAHKLASLTHVAVKGAR